MDNGQLTMNNGQFSIDLTILSYLAIISPADKGTFSQRLGRRTGTEDSEELRDKQKRCQWPPCVKGAGKNL